MTIEAGSGPAVLLVHGLNGFKEGWGALPAALAGAGLRAVAVDLPGFGATARLRRTTPQALADAIAPLVADLAPVSLVAHSLGAQVAMLTAAARPARIGGIALLAPWVLARPRRFPPRQISDVLQLPLAGRPLARLLIALARRSPARRREAYLRVLGDPESPIRDPALAALLEEAGDRLARGPAGGGGLGRQRAGVRRRAAGAAHHQAHAGRGGYPRPRDRALRRQLAGRRPPGRAAPVAAGRRSPPPPRGARGGRRGDRRPPAMTDLLHLAARAARAAGDLLLERSGGPASGVASKTSRTDLVSDTDRAAEALIVGMIRAERPDDAIVGEEGADAPGSGEVRWLVDPLDGTINYLWGIPQWSVSLAALDREGPLAGVVHDPSRGETFTAARGGGARLGERTLRVGPGAPLDEALVGTGFSYRAAERARQAALLQEILPAVRDVRRFGSAAIDLAWVACGRLDGYYERGLNPWDWAAGRLIVSEAGGVVQELPATAEEPLGCIAAPPALIGPLRALVDRARV